MSNPDDRSYTTATKQSEVTSATSAGLYMGLAEAIILFIVVIILFRFADITIRAKLMWIVLPILAFFIAIGLNFGSQYIACGKTNSKNALLGALASPVAVLVGLAVSSIESCRIPVASVFAPLFSEPINAKNATSNAKSNATKKCCASAVNPLLTEIESKYPLVKMCSHIFYVSFSVVFGSVIGTSIATVC